MLTPEDIDKQQFSKQFKGYAVEEVDDFLEELTNDYEVLMLANKKQEDKIKELEIKLNSVSTNTNVLQETLLIAKQNTLNFLKNEIETYKAKAERMLIEQLEILKKIEEQQQNQ